MDSSIFISIPCMVILKSLLNEDKQICQSFYPTLANTESGTMTEFTALKNKYNHLVSTNSPNSSYDLYNLIEKKILEEPLDQELLKSCHMTEEEMEAVVQMIKKIAMELQRYNPSQWNSFMNVAIGNS